VKGMEIVMLVKKITTPKMHFLSVSEKKIIRIKELNIRPALAEWLEKHQSI
jgi:hypothetical protein